MSYDLSKGKIIFMTFHEILISSSQDPNFMEFFPSPRSSAHKALPTFNIYNDEFHSPFQFLQCGPLYQVLNTWTYNFHFVRVRTPHVKNTNVIFGHSKRNPTNQPNPTRRFQPTPRGTQGKPPRAFGRLGGSVRGSIVEGIWSLPGGRLGGHGGSLKDQALLLELREGGCHKPHLTGNLRWGSQI